MICRKNPSFLIFRGWVIVLKWLEFIKEYDYDKEFEDNTHESSSKSDTDETSHEAESFWTPKTYFSLEEVPDLDGQ